MNQKKRFLSKCKRKNLKHGLRIRAFALCFVMIFAALLGLGSGGPHKVRAKGQEYMSIDTLKAYEGMEQSYSQGYQPSVKDGRLRLIIPFHGEEKFVKEIINVRLIFPAANGPFLFRNYQQQVACDKNNLYLYDCEIELDSQRVNGRYPIGVIASGKTVQGQYFEYKTDIYVEITDGKPSGQNGDNQGTNPGGDGGKDQNGNNIGSDPNGGENGSESGDGNGNQNGESGGENGDDGLGSGLGENLPGESGDPSLPEEGQGVNDSEPVSHQPRILMTENSLAGQELKAGESYDFNVGFKNYGKSGTIKNVKITLLTGEAGIDFEETNWYYDEISSGESIEMTQKITVQKKSAHGSAALEFVVEYEDVKGTAFTSSEKTKLFVMQDARASLISSPFPQKIQSTETTNLSMQVQNYGLSPIYNVRVTVEGAGLFPTKELFWGTVESGAAVEGELPVYVGMKNMTDDGETTDAEPYGKAEGTIKLSYEDEKGTVIEEVASVKTNITKPKRESEKKEEKEQKSTQWVYAVYAGSLILLLTLTAAVFLRLHHYKKQISMRQ